MALSSQGSSSSERDVPVTDAVWCVPFERITADPNRMRSLPCIRDTRVTVSAVLGQLAAGRTVEDVLVDYP